MDIKQHRTRWIWIAALVGLLAALPAFAADGDKSTIKGLITAVNGDVITVKDQNNVERTVNLQESTTYKMKKGLAAVRYETVQKSSLMPGLRIVADVVAAGSGFNATAISYGSEDFRTAQQVQAGVAPTQAGVEANAARMNDFGTYEAIATAEVLFGSGSSAISSKGKSDLAALAEKAKGTKDYRVVVQGFTDSTGDAATNQALSTKRATAVTNYLQQQGGLSPGRVQAGDGMGVAADAGSGSNAGARKVVVKLVVDKGVEGGKK
jgi:outer membrane protein OmpA-like peptidoglycan-associated protein